MHSVKPFLFVALLASPVLAEAPAVPAPAAEILITRQLAEDEGLSVGSRVRLSASPDGEEAGEYTVAGIYEPVPDPMLITANRHETRMHLDDLLALTAGDAGPAHFETVDSINVLLREPKKPWAFAMDLMRRSPTLDARPAAGADRGATSFVILERFHLAIALVTVFGSTAFLLALMVMRSEERRETVGILRLIGFSKPRVLSEVFIEGLVIAVVGAAFGVLLAGATQSVFNRFFQWRYDTGLVFVRVTAEIAWRCIALAVPLGVFAGLLASWNLLRREILSLLRR